MSLLLNRTTAPQVIRFFDLCFKQGVIDACELGDNIEAREFYENKSSDWSFGVLSISGEYDWQSFRYWSYWIARRNGLKSLAEGYFFRIRGKNYTWCILPYAMRFYLMGVSEWLRYPNPVNLQFFKIHPKIHWDPNEKLKSITKPDFFSYLHEFEFEFRRVPEEERIVSETAMTSFVQALFDLTRKYVVGKEEDF